MSVPPSKSARHNMRTHFIVIILLCLAGFNSIDASKDKKDADADSKEALQALQDFIGNWKGFADGKKLGGWNEKSTWGWRFKGKDVWLNFTLENSKLYKSGEVRYLSERAKYQFTLIDKA